MKNYEILSAYLDALRADNYIVQLVHPTEKPLRLAFTELQVLKSAGYFAYQNYEGYNIYARPVGWQYVLLDDLKYEALKSLAPLKPCILMETSPQNFQAWLRLSKVPSSRAEALSICKELAQRFGADQGSAEPDHVGRLPGYTNRKEKYRNELGQYPYVALRAAEYRESLFTPLGGVCETKRKIPVKLLDIDRSRADFKLVCSLLYQRKPEYYIRELLLASSEKARERGEQYVRLTIKNARKITGQYY